MYIYVHVYTCKLVLCERCRSTTYTGLDSATDYSHRYIYTCMYIHVYTCTAATGTCIYMYVHVYIHVHVHAIEHLLNCINRYMYMYMYTCIYMYVYVKHLLTY